MNWKKTPFTIFLVILFNTIGLSELQAEGIPAYVTNQAQLHVHQGPSNNYPILKSLPTGTTVSIVDDTINNGYVEIKLQDGSKGYALIGSLTSSPAKIKLDYAQQSVATIQQNYSTEEIQTTDLIKERNQLANRLERLQHTAANALDIERQRNDLQERLVNLERNNRHLKLQNQALMDKSSHKWFLLGAGVLFAGIIIGLLLTRISVPKKTSTWDNL
ncbi:MAG: TIGR04211 family SH3 domain-containing protein [Methylococcales bacterium]